MKISFLILIFILSSYGQELFQTESNKNFMHGPKLYLSRENPMYSQNKTKIKSENSEDDESDFYTRQILGLNTQQNRFISQTPDAKVVAINRPIHVSKDSPLYRYYTNINPDTQKSNNHEDNDDFVVRKNNPVVLENGTLILRGFKIKNSDHKDINLPYLPDISSYKIKNIRVNNDQPIVQRISTIKFNGETVTPEFLRNYFSQKFKITDDEFETSGKENYKNRQKNTDGYGLIDVRSNFNTEPKMSKLTVLRKRGIGLTNATTSDAHV